MMYNDMKYDAPDSCYSWVIATACNLIYFFIFGLVRVSGIIFAEIVVFYNIDRQLASLPFAMNSSIRSFTGPFAGCLIEALGFRPVIMMGSIFIAIGVGGCFFADNIVTFCILWGLLFGIGDALATSALPQIIYLYFEKHVTTATGFALTGAPIAGFVLSPITYILLSKYGLSGTYLMLAGMVLHVLPVAMFLKEPKSISQLSNVSCIERNNNVGDKVTENVNNSSSKSAANHLKSGVMLHPNSLTPNDANSNEKTDRTEDRHQTFSQSVIRISDPTNFQCTKNSETIIQCGAETNEKKPNRWLHILRILCHPVFILISVPRCLQMLSYIIVPTVLVDFSNDKGISGKMGAYILMCVYGADLFGKVAFGWVTDKGYLTVAKFASLCYVMTAASFACIVWPNSFSMMMIAVVFLGLCLGAISTISPRLISEYIEVEKQTVAMASGDILLGPVGLLIPSLIGYFRDDLGSYSWLMYMMSILLSACSVLLLFLPKVANWKTNKDSSPKN